MRREKVSGKGFRSGKRDFGDQQCLRIRSRLKGGREEGGGPESKKTGSQGNL